MTGGTSAISLGMPATTASASSSASNASTNASSMKQQQRSLIIQKDERGFGFKVSGSNPVEVAFVTEGGAADRAGVRPGDKIVKVNGTRVFNSDHSVVVRTIKDAGSYVALTVISPAPISSGVPGTEDTSLAPSATSGVLNLANSSTNSSGGNSVYANNNIGTQQISGLANDASSSNPLVSTLPPSIAALSHLSQQPSQCQQSYLVSSSSLRSTRPLSPITTGLDSATVSSTTNLLDQNSPPSSSSHGNSRPGLTSGPSITSPLPAPESVQLECEKTREKTLKEYIRKDKELLSSLIASNAPQEQIDGTKDRLNLLKRNLKLVRGKRSFMPRNIFTSPGSNAGALNFSSNHPHLQHMSSSTTHLLSPESMYGSSIGGFSALGSNDDIASSSKGMFDPSSGGIINPAIASSVSTAPQGPSSTSFWSRGLHSSSKYSKETGSGSSNRKSHSFKDELLREPKETILSMESDDEEDDEGDEGDATGGGAGNIGGNDEGPNEGTNEMLNANILSLAAQKKNESKSSRNRKKSKDLIEEPDISNIEDLTNALLNHKKLIISNISGSNTSSSASASASAAVSKNPKDKINGRRKGSSSRSSFMSSSISAEELEWLKESKKLMLLISHSFSFMHTEIDHLLFYTLATLIQRELTVTTTSSSTTTCNTNTTTATTSASSTSASATATVSSSSSSPCSQVVKPGTEEALFELISIFLLPDSPLALKALPPHLMSQAQLDLLTSSFMVPSCPSSPSNATSAGSGNHQCQLHDLLTPYINFARTTVNDNLIKSFNLAKEVRLRHPSVMNVMSLTAKEKKKSAREFMGRLLTEAIQFQPDANPNLPAEANFFSEGDSLVPCLKALLQGQPLKGDQTDSIPYSHTMARVLSLLSTFYHFLPHSIFLPSSSAIHSELEHFILLNTLVSSKPGGPGGTSGHSDSSGPRHKSLPSSLGSSIAGTFAGSITSPTGLPLPVASSGQTGKVEIDPNFILTAAKQPAQAGGGKKGKSAPATVSLIPAGHLISSPPFTTLSSISYCSACGHLLWGKPNYLLICSRCKVKCHYWCYFTSIHNSTSTMYPCLPMDGSVNLQGSNVNFTTSAANYLVGHHPLHHHHHQQHQHQHHPHHHQRAHSAVSKNESSRRSFFFPDPSKIFKSNQTKSTSSFFPTDLQAHKLHPENAPFYSFISSSSSSSSYSSSSSSTDSESDSNLDEDDYVSASSDPSTPILKSKIKRIKKTKRSKSLEEGVISSSVATGTTDGDAGVDAGNVVTSKSKEYEQANEEEANKKRMAKQKIRKKLKQRKMNTLELIRTEKSFGKKLLLLHDLFYVQIVRSPGLLTKDEINTLFSNHLQLMDLHSKLYGQLREQLRPCLRAKRSKVDWKYVANTIELIFTELGPSLKEEVAVFCSNVLPANELLKAKTKSSKLFSILLTEAESAGALNKLKLTDLLAAPFQRIMRYPLLVNEIFSTFDSLVDSSNGKFARKEAEARTAFDSALTVIKAIVHGVNRRKSEFEFLSWFKTKVTPFYPKYADLTIDSLRLVAEGQVTWRFNREKSFSGHLLLLPDLLLILTQENSSNQVPSSSSLPMGSSTVTSSTSLMSVNSSASNTSTSPSIASTVASTTLATTSLNWSFLSKQLQEREASGATFVLKEAPVDGDKNPQTHTTVPVLEVTTDVSTRAHAINRTAFFLFSKGASGGQKSGSSAAMYELITVSEQAREALTECIINLVESKKQGVTSPVTAPVISSSSTSSSTNPFLPSYQDQQANQPVPPTVAPHTADTHSIRNRPLPPLPTSASLQGVAALSTSTDTRHSSSSSSHASHHSSMMRRSRSQDPGDRNIAISDQGSNVNLTSTVTGGPYGGSSGQHTSTSSTPANGAIHPPPPPPPPPQPDLPPIAGLIGKAPIREPLASYREAVNSIQPDVRFAQRVNVIGDSFIDDQTEHEQQLNIKILDLLRERRNLISAKKNTSPTNDHNNSDTQLADCLGTLALDAFTYELMLSTNDCDNDKSELRAKLINSLSKIA